LGCEAKDTTNSKIKIVDTVKTNISIDTSNIAILSYQKTRDNLFLNDQPTDLTSNDFLKIDSFLAK
jgi:hypothetical protein